MNCRLEIAVPPDGALGFLVAQSGCIEEFITPEEGLAFSAAALLDFAKEELSMEAHKVEEKPISTLVLFGGFLAFWSI
jgi:hypothetical protein